MPSKTISSGTERTAFRSRLLRWYDVHRRDLPWRHTRDAYAIWVAEIMLQQTRVAAVLEHYRHFLQCFPTIEALAHARQSAVLAAWSGLGYYRRARALHGAARVVLRDFGGRLPETEQELKSLPGVGRYTASAVASTAFGRACPVVDGNVERVLTRLLARRLSQRRLWELAEELLSRHRPGDFNQAMMELGATLCLPAAPACERCPVQQWCATYEARRATPARLEHPGPSMPARRRRRHVRYLLAIDNEKVLLVCRAATSSLMPQMWELPAADGAGAAAMKLRHAITNTDYLVTIVCAPAPKEVSGRWVHFRRLRQLPLTGLARKVLRKAGIKF